MTLPRFPKPPKPPKPNQRKPDGSNPPKAEQKPGSLFHSPRGFDAFHETPLRKSHRPRPPQGLAGVWLPRTRRIPADKDPVAGSSTAQEAASAISYVYLFVHASENRFKIGRSYSPQTRLTQLPEAGQIDQAQSLQIELPDRTRAAEVESLLHKGLSAYRLQLSWSTLLDHPLAHLHPNPEPELESKLNPQPLHWDGETEWFSLSGLHHAVTLVSAVPGLMQDGGALLQTLDGQPYWLWRSSQDRSRGAWLRHEATSFNEAQLDRIGGVLLQLKRQLVLRWCKSDFPTDAGILRIEGFKAWWDPETVNVRLKATTNELWALKTGKPALVNSEISMLRLIRFAVDKPGDLELVFGARARIRKVPAGALVLRRWGQFVAGLAQT